jgi:hypothetical protein
MSEQRSLFEQIVESSGLAATIGPGTVQRALSSVGVLVPEAASPEDYLRALPQLRARMTIYLGAADAERRALHIESLLK